jgi:hypothetical protein
MTPDQQLEDVIAEIALTQQALFAGEQAKNAFRDARTYAAAKAHDDREGEENWGHGNESEELAAAADPVEEALKAWLDAAYKLRSDLQTRKGSLEYKVYDL